MSRPWRASGEANSLRQVKLGDVWPASPTPLTRFYRFVFLRQVQARPTHYNSELLLCSTGGHTYVASLKVFRDVMVRSEAQYPRDALSKGCNIQEFSVGDTPVGDEITLHPPYLFPPDGVEMSRGRADQGQLSSLHNAVVVGAQQRQLSN